MIPEASFEKVHFFPSHTDDDQLVFPIRPRSKSGLLKTAASKGLSKDILTFIDALEPDPGRRYVLINALGAQEYYGSNINGDASPEAGLTHEGPDYGYKTFEMYGYFYPNHANKDPKNRRIHNLRL